MTPGGDLDLERLIPLRRNGLVPSWACVLALACAPSAEPPTLPTTHPVTVLEARVDHGFGDTPFDSPLWRDSVNAALLLSVGHEMPRPQLLATTGNAAEMESRLQQLERAGLLVATDSTVRTSFPLLIGSSADRYYRITARSAAEILDRFTPAIDSLLAELDRRGWQQWSYHFVWSQLLDSQFAWEAMLQGGMVPPLSPAQAWVVYHPHPNKTGTNLELPDNFEGFLLALSWAPGGNTTRKVGPNWEVIYRAALADRAATAEAARTLRKLHLLGPDEKVQVPVIRARGIPCTGT